MQKPIFWLYLVIVASVSINAVFTDIDSTVLLSNEGVHPKNEPIDITCPNPLTAYVGAFCKAQVKVPLPESDCNITSVEYRLNPAHSWIPISGPVFPDSLSLPDSVTVSVFSIYFRSEDDCGPETLCTLTVTVLDTIPPVIVCPHNVTAGNNPDDGRSFPVLVDAPLTESDNCGFSVVNDYNNSDDASDSYPLGTTTVIWTITDNSNNSATCSMTVTVVDNTPPVITCPPIITLQCVGNDPFTDYPDFEAGGGNASDDIELDTLSFTLISEVNNSPAWPLIIMRTYEISDTAGNKSSCVHTVTVADAQEPDFVCIGLKKISVSDYPELPAGAFVLPGYTDNCGGNVSISVRRVDLRCDPDADIFGPYVKFCCADVPDTVMVEVRVTDERNNANTCMVSVVVDDKIPPSILMPLPDITISCSYPLNLNDLSAFGTFVPNGSPPGDIIINDPGNPPGFIGQDGVYTDNCPDVQVTVTVRNMLNMCNTGDIKRDFKFKDVGGDSIIFTQTITVKDYKPFVIQNITWPAQEVFYPFCNVQTPDPNVTGRPEFFIDRCSQVAATSSDQSFSHPIYCRYVRRTWTVIDWCQYTTNTPGGPGKWTYIQHIYVTNNVPPTINAAICRDSTICAQGAACSAQVTLVAAGSDDCMPVNISWSYKVDFNNNGSFDQTGQGNTFSRTMDRGTHRIVWEAKDQCSNISTCTQIFTVKECKSPTPVALQGLVINLTNPGPLAKIWASDFNNFSNDNCTPTGQLRFSFSSDPNDNTRMFDCSHIGKQYLNFWVTDLDGNQAFASTWIIVQDNHLLCGNLPKISISGRIHTEEGVFIPDTKVLIDGGETEGQCMTDQSGGYSFGDLAMYNSYELSPLKDSLPLEGISTLDLVLIQRHILGLESISSPYRLIAADVNHSGSVTAADLTELRKLILGVNQRFTNNTSWRFVDAGYVFPDPSNPWPWTEILQYDLIETDMTQSDFIAVKTGDVNGSVSALYSEKQTERRKKDGLELITEDVFLQAGDLVSIPLKTKNKADITGLQWTLQISDDLEFLGFEAEKLPLKSDETALISRNNKQYFTASFVAPELFGCEEDEILLHLTFSVKNSGRISRFLSLNNDVTPSEVYNREYETGDISLGFRAAVQTMQNAVLQNQPNPFREETTLQVQLASKGPLSINIYDSEGKAVYRNTTEYPSGNHRISITDKQLGNRTGVFYCKIKAGDLNDVIRILRIE
jgi:hypothetical protein